MPFPTTLQEFVSRLYSAISAIRGYRYDTTVMMRSSLNHRHNSDAANVPSRVRVQVVLCRQRHQGLERGTPGGGATRDASLLLYYSHA